jgi:hypothetical protein
LLLICLGCIILAIAKCALSETFSEEHRSCRRASRG